MGLQEAMTRLLGNWDNRNEGQSSSIRYKSRLDELKAPSEGPQLSNEQIFENNANKFRRIFGCENGQLTVAIPLHQGSSSYQLELELPVQLKPHLLISMEPETVYDYLNSIDNDNNVSGPDDDGFDFNRSRVQREAGCIVVRLVNSGGSNAESSNRNEDVYLAPYERHGSVPDGQNSDDYCWEPQWRGEPSPEFEEAVLNVLNQLNDGLSGEFRPIGSPFSMSGPRGEEGGGGGRGTFKRLGDENLDKEDLRYSRTRSVGI
jgi:hypothetical protein